MCSDSQDSDQLPLEVHKIQFSSYLLQVLQRNRRQKVIMLPNKSPNQNLKITIPLTRRPSESPETSPLGSPVKSESTDRTIKDGNDRDDVESGGAKRDGGTEIGSADGGSTRRDSTASLAHLGLSYVDNADAESLARLGVSYLNRDATESIRQNTRIKHWNCHAVCIYLYIILVSTIPATIQ